VDRRNRCRAALVISVTFSVGVEHGLGVAPTVTGPFPSEQSVCVCAGSVQFGVTANGGPGLCYQWRRGETNLVDGLVYAGANTATLTIKDITARDAGDNYNCVITDAGEEAISDMATLIVNAASGDFDHDCDVDPDDAQLFRACLSGSGMPLSAECTGKDFDLDNDVDMCDFGILQRWYGNESQPAIPAPRDIVFVLDLSSSMHNESLLASVSRIEVANRGVWAHLWDNQYGDPPTEGGLPAGPFLGNMNTWGDAVTGANGINTNDPGLVYLPRNQSWTLSTTWTSQTLAAQGYGDYTTAEMAVINSSAYDSNTNAYRRRVQVALGLLRWKSGKAGGQPGGNGDNVIDSDELPVLVPYPSQSGNPVTQCRQVGGSWGSYVDYVMSSSSLMSIYDPGSRLYGDPDCRCRYGLKTWVDFVQSVHPGGSQSPGLAGAPHQPMRTMIDGIGKEIGIVLSQQGDDQVGMAGFGSDGYGPADKPDNMAWLTDDFDSVLMRTGTFQAAMWTSFSNTARGIDKAVGVVFGSPQARPNAAKIVVLLTDGYPNYTRNPAVYDPIQALQDAEAAARDAAARGVIMYTIGVGDAVDDQDLQDWLANLAAIGRGSFFAASRDLAIYQAQLQDMLRQADACENAP
jgi:hypothetical protein